MSELNFLTSHILRLVSLALFICLFVGSGFAASVGEFQKFLSQNPASEIFETADAYGELLHNGKIAPIQKNGEIPKKYGQHRRIRTANHIVENAKFS